MLIFNILIITDINIIIIISYLCSINKIINIFKLIICIFIVKMSRSYFKILENVTNLSINLNKVIMINLKVVYQGKDFELNLPTMFSEIDVNYLSSLVANVNVAPNYSLIALLFKDRPYAIISSIKQSKYATVSAAPIMIKSGKSNIDFINNIKLGDRLTIAPSDIVYGNQVNAKYNSLNPNLLASLIKDNRQLYTQTQSIQQDVYFVDFKIVPSNVIHAAINAKSSNVVDCYFKEIMNKA